MLTLFVLLCVFTSKSQTSDVQYPSHIDLQKVGEAIFNNEKFNILKPTTHIISDYFEEFMLRRENTDFPTKRVFIDRNGFRHFWSGFETASKSLRKTDDINANLITNTAVNKKNKNIVAKFGIEDIKILDAETFIMPSKGRRNIKFKIKKQALRDDDTEDKAVEENTPDNDDETTTTTTTSKDDEITTTLKDDEIATTLEDGEIMTNLKDVEIITTLEDGEITTTPKADGDETTVVEPNNDSNDTTITEANNITEATTAKIDTTSEAQPKPDKRVVAKTTFFCPFFGVMTMAAFLD